MDKKILNAINEIDLLFDKELEELIYKKSKLISKQDGESTYINGNTEGILWLIMFLLDIVKKQDNDHFHFDQYNGLEKGSTELIFEKNDNI